MPSAQFRGYSGLSKVYSKIKPAGDLTILTAIKTTGTANANHIVLDESLRMDAPSRVSVIVFFENGDDDISEAEWLKGCFR